MLNRFGRWTPAIVYMVLIFYSSSQSDPAPVLTQNVWDKLLHAVGFGVLALLYLWALSGKPRAPMSLALAAVVLTSAYAASDEIHQIFTPGRMADIRDWAADTTGGVIAVAAAMISMALRRPRPLRP